MCCSSFISRCTMPPEKKVCLIEGVYLILVYIVKRGSTAVHSCTRSFGEAPSASTGTHLADHCGCTDTEAGLSTRRATHIYNRQQSVSPITQRCVPYCPPPSSALLKREGALRACIQHGLILRTLDFRQIQLEMFPILFYPCLFVFSTWTLPQYISKETLVPEPRCGRSHK